MGLSRSPQRSSTALEIRRKPSGHARPETHPGAQIVQTGRLTKLLVQNDSNTQEN